MKKIFTIIALLMTIIIGAKAETEKEIKFSEKISTSSTNALGLPLVGGTVTFTIDEDFVGTLTIPSKNTEFYTKNVNIETVLNNIDGLNISGEFSKNFQTDISWLFDQESLFDKLPNLYGDWTTKTFTVTVDGKNEVEFEVVKTANKTWPLDLDPTYTITITPNSTEYAKAAWLAITDHIASSSIDEDEESQLSIARDTYIKTSDKCLKFVEPCSILDNNNFENLTENLEAFQKATETTNEKFDNSTEIMLTPTSQLTLGGTALLTLMDSCKITSKGMYFDGLLDDIKHDVSKLLKEKCESKRNISAVADFFSFLKIIDGVAGVTDYANFDIDFTAPETRLQVVTSTFDEDDVPGAEVSFKIDENYIAQLTLPKEDVAMYANKIKVESMVQNIKGLGIEGKKTATKEKTTTEEIEPRYLVDYIPNTYALTKDKHVVIKMEDCTPVTYTVSKRANEDGSYLITMIPDCKSDLQTAWTTFCQHIQATDVKENREAYIAKGTYLINNDEKLKFIKDCKLSGFRDYKARLQDLKDATTISECEETNKVKAALAPGSYVSLGNHIFTLNETGENDTCHITIDNETHTFYMPNKYLSGVKNRINELLNDPSKGKKDFINYAFEILKDVDYYLVNDDEENDPIEITISFKSETPTAINNVVSETSATKDSTIYTINGCRVNNMKAPGIYISNGKKIVK